MDADPTTLKSQGADPSSSLSALANAKLAELGIQWDQTVIASRPVDRLPFVMLRADQLDALMQVAFTEGRRTAQQELKELRVKYDELILAVFDETSER